MTIWVSQQQKIRSILEFNEARYDGVAVASTGPYANHLHHTPDNHASTSAFLPPNQQYQSTKAVYIDVPCMIPVSSLHLFTLHVQSVSTFLLYSC